MNARFIVTNAVILALGFVAFHAGLFDGFPPFKLVEYILCGALVVYASIGFIAIWCKNWPIARHIAHGVTVWGLPCTGVGMIMAVGDAHTLEPAVMLAVFRDLVFSLAPNILATLLLAWLREVMWWASDEDDA